MAGISCSGSRTPEISATMGRSSPRSWPAAGLVFASKGGKTAHRSTPGVPASRTGPAREYTRRMPAEPLRLPLEIEDIKKVLPHRYPFLLVDRILEMEEDRRVLGVKNVSANERYFIAGPGGRPVLPASILTEAMAQAGAVLILAKPENRSRLIYFMGIDKVRYRR